MVILLFSSGFESTTPSNPVSSDIRANNSFTCLPGQCATNLISGIKTCPTTDIEIGINPAEEVCNSRYLCDNPLTPFAVQSDGSTNISGICEDKSECSCLNTITCPNYILSVFTASGGNPYVSTDTQRINFPQENVTRITDISRNFCTVPLTWLPISTPGCNFVSDPNQFTYIDLLECMNLPNTTDLMSPCLNGVLSLISNNPDLLTQDNIINQQFGCTRGTQCPPNELSVFDTNLGTNICKQLQ